MKTKNIQRVALVGGGVIGSGWATRCLAHGLSVVVTDPSPAAVEMVLKTVDSAWPILEEAGIDEKADRSKLEFAPDIETAVADADFVQETYRSVRISRLLCTKRSAGTPKATLWLPRVHRVYCPAVSSPAAGDQSDW